MSLNHSPSIVTNGLIMYCDMNNTQKSWLGKPTTNLITNGNFVSGSISPWSTYNVTPTVVLLTGGALPYPTFNSNVMQFTSTSGTSGASLNVTGFCTVGQVYTFSFYSRILSGAATAGLSFNNQNGSGDVNAWNSSVTLTSYWQKFTFSFTYDVAKTTLYFYHGSTGITSQFTEFQLEQSTFATPFTLTSRSTSQAIVDLTNNNTLTISSLTYASDNTFSFTNASSNKFQSQSTTISFVNGATVELILKSTDLASRAQGAFQFVGTGSQGAGTHYINVYFGGNGKVRWEVIANYPNGNTALTSYYSASTLANNTWYHLCFTATTGGAGVIYINGVSDATATFTSPILGTITSNIIIGEYGGYFSGSIPVAKFYNRALSANEIAQNFNALRSRYSL